MSTTEHDRKFDKTFYEEYAKIAVCHLLGLSIGSFKHRGDKPDLQNVEANLGIEVVQAITEHDGLVNSLTQKHFGKGLSGEQIVEAINRENTQGRFKGRVFCINGAACISPTTGTYDLSVKRKIVIEKIEEKSKKFAGYAKFGTNGLYCFCNQFYVEAHDLFEFESACCNSPFQVIFFDVGDAVFQWDAATKKFAAHAIPMDLLKSWKKQAIERET